MTSAAEERRVSATGGPLTSQGSSRRATDPLSAELRLIGACLAWPRTPQSDEEVRVRAAHALNWRRITELVERHRVAGLVYHALRRAGVEPEGSAAQELWVRAQQTAFEELRLAAELSRITSEAIARGQSVTVLKGLAAALQGYGRIGLRQNRDLDLLVATDDVSGLIERLEHDGYVQVEPEARLSASELVERMRTHKDIVFRHAARQTVVELHWRLFDNRQFATCVELSRRVTLKLPTGVKINALSPEDAFLYMSGHGAQHAWSRLKWLADFGAYCSALGEERVAILYASCRGSGLGRAMAQGLLLSHELMGAQPPEAVLKDLAISWRLRLLRRVGLRALGSHEAIELEDRIFGPTLKTLSHYLLSDRLADLVAQAILDASEPPSAQASPIARRLGPLAKAPLWIYDRAKMALRRN